MSNELQGSAIEDAYSFNRAVHSLEVNGSLLVPQVML